LFAANDDIVTTPLPDGDLTTIAAMVLPIFPIAVAISANLDPHLGEFHAGIRLGDGKSGDWSDRGKAGGRHNNQCKLPHDVPPHNGRRTNAASRLSFQFDANTPHIFRNNVPETTAWAFSETETGSAVSQSYSRFVERFAEGPTRPALHFFAAIAAPDPLQFESAWTGEIT
jgi:hypothetical protein